MLRAKETFRAPFWVRVCHGFGSPVQGMVRVKGMGRNRSCVCVQAVEVPMRQLLVKQCGRDVDREAPKQTYFSGH